MFASADADKTAMHIAQLLISASEVQFFVLARCLLVS